MSEPTDELLYQRTQSTSAIDNSTSDVAVIALSSADISSEQSSEQIVNQSVATSESTDSHTGPDLQPTNSVKISINDHNNTNTHAEPTKDNAVPFTYIALPTNSIITSTNSIAVSLKDLLKSKEEVHPVNNVPKPEEEVHPMNNVPKPEEKVHPMNNVPKSEEKVHPVNNVPKSEEEVTSSAVVLRRTVSDTAVSSQLACQDLSGSTLSHAPDDTATNKDGKETAEKEIAFPSISNNILKQLGLKVRVDRGEPFSDHEIETRFVALSLAFKTDRLTLTSRLELQKRHRDQAETNMAAEVTKLKAALHKLSRFYISSDSVEALAQIQTQVDVLQQATDRVSGSAERFGAVQQEHRLSTATEVLMLHIENVKRSLEKSGNNVEDLKRVLTENNIVMEDSDLLDEPTPRTMRYRSLAAPPGKRVNPMNAQRRASIAAIPRALGSPPDASRSLSNLHTLPDLRPKSPMGMATVVNTVRMKTSSNSINALITSTTVVCDWPEKIVNEMGPIEEASESQKEKPMVVEDEIIAEVNNNVGNERIVKEQEMERPKPRLSVVDTVDSGRSFQEGTMVTENFPNPVQYLRTEVNRLIVTYREEITDYIQDNRIEIISKARVYISSLLVAAAACFLLWSLIPQSEAKMFTH